MKRIQYSRYGGPELMRVEDFELPAVGTGEVAVRVKFAAINPIEEAPRWPNEDRHRQNLSPRHGNGFFWNSHCKGLGRLPV